MKYIIILLLLASCNPLKKAVKTFDDNPAAAALYCATNFPAKDSLIPGDTIVKTDTLTEGVFIEVPCDTVKIRVECPPTRTITKTVHVTDTIVRVDHAKEVSLQATVSQRDNTIGEQAKTINRKQTDLDDMKGKRNWWRIVALILAGVLGLATFLKIKRII